MQFFSIFLKDVFYTKPLQINFWLPLSLEIFIICFIIKAGIPEGEDLILLILYLILCFVYYYRSWGKINYIFNSFSSIPSYTRESDFFQFIEMFSAFFKLISQIVFISVLFENYLSNQIIINILTFLTTGSLTYVLISCIISQVIFIPPILAILFGGIPIFLSSVLGLEKAILNWTFIALVFVTVLPQFFSFDLKYLLSTKILEQVEKQEEKIKKAIYGIKFSIYLFIPIAYLFLNLSEKILYSKSFIHIYNILNVQHISAGAVEYFSVFNLIASLLKMFTFIFAFLFFCIYREWVLNEIQHIFILNHSEIMFDSGKYFKMVYKDKKWEKSSSYYAILGEQFIHYNKFKKYIYNGSSIKLNNSESKLIKYISDDIFKVNGEYYVREFSDSMMKINGKSKREGNYILRKPGYSIFWPVAIILVISFANIWYSKTIIPQSFRGHYVHEKIESKKIVFEEENIILTNGNDVIEKNYLFDDESLLVKDEVGNIVGRIEVLDRSIFKIFDLTGEVVIYGKESDDTYSLKEYP